MTGTLEGSSLGSPGFDELRWLRPVRPGETLYVVGEVLEKKASSSRQDRGIVRIRYTSYNQRDEEVMTMVGNQIIRRRP
jgi:acyl dehydratase